MTDSEFMTILEEALDWLDNDDFEHDGRLACREYLENAICALGSAMDAQAPKIADPSEQEEIMLQAAQWDEMHEREAYYHAFNDPDGGLSWENRKTGRSF